MLVGLLLGLSLAWAAAIVWAPAALLRGAADGPALRAAAVLVYATGSQVCHQRPERTFRAAGRPMPVCARCFGLYVAVPFGLAAALAGLGLGAARLSPRLALAAAALPTAATLFVEWSGLADPGNVIRFAAALPLSATAAWVIGRGLVREALSQTSVASRVSARLLTRWRR